MITKDNYTTLDTAYTFFNKELFENELPDCIITLQRKSRVYGYYSHERFSKRNGSDKISEIALNPDNFKDRTDEEILSTLVHEMTHLYQYYFEDPPRKGYHDRAWGRIMKDVGLYPSNTGEPGGKETGQQMTHYSIKGGKFEISCGAFLLKNKLSWESEKFLKVNGVQKKTRYKYTCPSCLTNIWAKPDINISCGDCKKKFIIEQDDE